MHYNVPQFIDIEDRIVGPLTAKQLLWLFGLAAILFLLWVAIENKINFFFAAAPISLLFLGLTFYRPYGQPLSKFISSMLIFFFRPKVYVWKRGVGAVEKKNYKKEVIARTLARKTPKQREIYDISKILDSEPDILNEINRKD
ncbi:MAG: PrgI family protein [Candidatus Moraniibacteriota bacterium]